MNGRLILCPDLVDLAAAPEGPAAVMAEDPEALAAPEAVLAVPAVEAPAAPEAAVPAAEALAAPEAAVPVPRTVLTAPRPRLRARRISGTAASGAIAAAVLAA